MDLDHDPYDEHLVASPGADTGGKTDNGLVQALSGRTGAVLYQRAGDSSLDRFGWSIAFAGDVDGDGVRDVIVGAPFAVNASNVATGMARVLSGASGAVLRTLYGLAAGDRFGWSVDGGFDSNNDNIGDLIVGAPEGDTTTFGDCGYVSTFSGASGTLLLRVLGTTNGARLGTAVAVVGDANGDNRRDFAAGAPGPNAGQGRVTLWNGQSVTAAVTVLWNSDGANAGDELGCSLAGMLDANSDGLGDLVCGARGEDIPTATNVGAVRVLSGANGTTLAVVRGDVAAGQLGQSVAVIGNVNNVPGREVLVGGPNFDTARVFDPTSGEVVIELVGQGGTSFGRSVADAGDFDNDGVPDFVVGQPGFDGPTLVDNGRAVVYSASPWMARFCASGTSSSGCTPLMSWAGLPRASAASGFTLTASGLEGQKSGLFFYSLSGRQQLAWGASSSFLCVKAPTQRCVAQSTAGTAGSCNGFLVFDWLAWRAAYPTALGGPLNAGELVQAQGWYRDPPSAKTTQLTNAIEFLVAP
ncbi:MAG: integrin alpha [Planctomycetota bacterium]